MTILDDEYFEDGMEIGRYSWDELGNGVARNLDEAIDNRWEEQRQREKSKCNLVIFNIKELCEEEVKKRIEHDKEECRDLFREVLKIQSFSLEKITRLGRVEKDKSRPILVRLGSGKELKNLEK